MLRGEADLASLDCPGRPRLLPDWEERLLARVPAARRDAVGDEDESFERWY
ncbi:MAG: hypothetical protein JO238_03025 [Alphaproteobacteria bacterium]|nr:hypothetical protein [Alphaproteobacteria bacterium]MBV9372584.1 hypothetical protein [Alphaproteobacteria bacterium]